MNRLSLLGFLGLLGLLGWATRTPVLRLLWFPWLFVCRTLEDERFHDNLGKAAKNALVAGIALFPLIVVWAAFTSFQEAYAVGFAVNFTLQLLVFTISLARYEQGGGGS